MLNHVQGQVWKRVWIFEASSENGCGKWHFLVWNWVWIWRCGRHTPRVQITNHEPEKFRLDCWKCVNCEAARLTWRWFWMLHVVAESLFLYFCVWVCLLCLVLMYWKFSNPWNKQIITLSPCLMWKSHHKIPGSFVEAAWPSDLGRWIWNLEAPPPSNPSRAHKNATY